jgi:hypothetical protein
MRALLREDLLVGLGGFVADQGEGRIAHLPKLPSAIVRPD